jgi:hypothetical protein
VKVATDFLREVPNHPRQDTGPNGEAMKFENMSEAELDARLDELL